MYINIYIYISILQGCLDTDIIYKTLKANIIRNVNVTSYTCAGKNINFLHPNTFNNTLELNILMFHVYLNSNILTTLHNNQFKVLIKLELIFLQYNSLTHIGKETFRYNIKLRRINLGHNLITIFNADLSHLSYLKQVKIQHNKLKTLNEYAFKSFIIGNESYKNVLSIYNNDLNCNCQMYWLLKLGDTFHANITFDISCKYIADSSLNNNILLQCFLYPGKLETSTCNYLNTTYCQRGLYIILRDNYKYIIILYYYNLVIYILDNLIYLIIIIIYFVNYVQSTNVYIV